MNPSPAMNTAVTNEDSLSRFHPIPSLSGWPLLGNLPEYLTDPLDLLLRVGSACGDIGMFRIMSHPLILINTPELVQAVLVEHAVAFENGPLLRIIARQLIGDGLLSADNLPHRSRRKLLAPKFQPKQIASYGETMVQYTEQLQQEWADGQEVNIASAMTGLTLRIVAQTLFGVDVAREADDLREALTTAIRMFVAEVTAPWHVPYRWPTPRHVRLRQALKQLDQTIYRMIAGRRASGEQRGDLLSTLLFTRREDGRLLSDEEVRDEALTFFIAGHETTANALAWAWYLVCQHPEVYTRLRDEVDAVLQGRSPSKDDLPNLLYTRMVLEETLRLYPPAYAFGRQAAYSKEVGGYHFPEGTLILISPYTLHRRADCFPDPERFDPERFGPARRAQVPRHAYLPFGDGPRICIGNHFALMEAQLILATLAQRVTFILLDGQVIEPEPLISLRQKQGARMIVRRREISGAFQ